MPTPLKRSPQELHKTYINNMEAFYKVAGRGLAGEIDRLVSLCARQLWQHSGGISQAHVDSINVLYSKGEARPSWLLWELTRAVCDSGSFLPPLFFWALVDEDVSRDRDASRLLIRVLTNILLYLAAVEDEISYAQAKYIRQCTESLAAICDAKGVKKSKAPLDAMDFVTNSEPSFTQKHQLVKTPGPAGDKAGDPAEKPRRERDLPVEKPDLDELTRQLDELTGLGAVKKDVKGLVNLMKVRRLRQANELPVPPMSLHLVFMGNPGTGKTTVARLLAGLYAAIGVLSKGQLVEVDRSGLVAGYVGQTAIKTAKVIDSALGGVLFIDEAYSLASGGDNDFGREAIETILKAMEDNRHDLVVIVAGYDRPMEKFLSSNPGLESRFNKYIYFPDYTGDELFEIFTGLCQKHNYVLANDALEQAREMFSSQYESRDDNFGNGRDVRNIFERMVSNHANRVAGIEDASKEDLINVLALDLWPEDGADEAPQKPPSD